MLDLEFFHCSKVQQGFVKILVESLFSGYEGYLFLVHRLEVYLFIKFASNPLIKMSNLGLFEPPVRYK